MCFLPASLPFSCCYSSPSGCRQGLRVTLPLLGSQCWLGSSAKAQSWRGRPNLCNFLSNNAALTSSQCLSCPGDPQPSPYLTCATAGASAISLSQSQICSLALAALSSLLRCEQPLLLRPPTLSVVND